MPRSEAGFSQQVILVSIDEQYQREFIADTLRLKSAPGVLDVFVNRPIRFKDPKLDWWIGNYDLAIFIRFRNEDITGEYGASALHEAWNKKWSDKFTTFRALRTTSGDQPIEYD
jgi:hypothetical protein